MKLVTAVLILLAFGANSAETLECKDGELNLGIDRAQAVNENTFRLSWTMPINSDCKQINRDQARANRINDETNLLAACADYRSLTVDPTKFPELEKACSLMYIKGK